MKSTTIKYILFLSLAFTSISCDKLAAIIPDIHVNVPLDITIDVKATDPSSYYKTFEVSGLNDSVAKYKNLIKDYVVDSVTMSVLEFTVPPTATKESLINGLSFYISNNNQSILIPDIYLSYIDVGSGRYYTKYYKELNVFLIGTSGKVNLNLPSDNLAALAYALKTTNKLSGTIYAFTTVKPLTVKIRLTFYATAKTH
jgi:hypothetical protein